MRLENQKEEQKQQEVAVLLVLCSFVESRFIYCALYKIFLEVTTTAHTDRIGTGGLIWKKREKGKGTHLFLVSYISSAQICLRILPFS